MPRYKVELLHVVHDPEGVDVVVEAATEDEAPRLALETYENDEASEIEFEAYARIDWSEARTGAVEKLGG